MLARKSLHSVRCRLLSPLPWQSPRSVRAVIELRFGDSRLAIGDESPEMGIVSPLTLGGTYGALHLAIANADAVWQKALGAGATVFEPLHDAFWGERTGQFIDPFGHRWAIDQHVRDVPPDEIARLAAQAFAGSQG